MAERTTRKFTENHIGSHRRISVTEINLKHDFYLMHKYFNPNKSIEWENDVKLSILTTAIFRKKSNQIIDI